jgi:succinate dehydrogenase / fumarate reductase cytochrome b subunit
MRGFNVKNKRPVFLDITKYKFPNTAIVSILHRISGVILFLYLPFLLWMLEKSLTTDEKFQELIHLLDNSFMKLLLWLLLAATIFHLVAGIRHLLMDMGIGESYRGVRIGANMVFVIAALLILVSGLWLW